MLVSMNRTFVSGFFAGIVVATLLGVLVVISRGGPEKLPAAPPKKVENAPPQHPDMAALRSENERLMRELEKRPAAPLTPTPPAPSSPPEPPLERLIEDFEALASESGLAAMGDGDFIKLRDAFRKRPAESVKKLGELLLNGKNAQVRAVAALMIEAVGDGSAVPWLEKSLKEEKDDLVRRCSSHAAALIRGEGYAPVLLQSMRSDTDWGVRVNSAYGLAKGGNDEGLQTLLAFYDSPEAKDYRIAVLGGIADVAHPTTAPMFRKMLAESSDVTLLSLSISAIEKMKDQASLPLLAQIVQGTAPESARNAAKKAYNTISGQEVYK